MEGLTYLGNVTEISLCIKIIIVNYKEREEKEEEVKDVRREVI